ncbi:MAG TPA: DUF2283 domain-containing protein [Caulobacteraceae bacterium]|jgi:uncharacterized protein YuzE|nr:DUF2283 domain-containing protein [Caulobacteraceae bacterium]
MSVRLHYDPTSDAAYLRFSEEAIVESEEVSPGLIVDFDADGRFVALEVLQAASRLPKDTLIAAE